MNRTLFSTDSGLIIYYQRQFSLVKNSQIYTAGQIRFIACDSEGYFWLCTNEGSFRLLVDQNNRTIYSEKFFGRYAVNNVFEDHDHNFWIATQSEGLLLVSSLKAKFAGRTMRMWRVVWWRMSEKTRDLMRVDFQCLIYFD